ncbi:unnamed protein product [Linum tenue]|uniref:K Homology domain-containing protein n=1 Tax=Linum tenue TaxID=586396 RepID=A0AAV0LXC9_9ROSI|nr:unnamed protein product [Linum tenue]
MTSVSAGDLLVEQSEPDVPPGMTEAATAEAEQGIEAGAEAQQGEVAAAQPQALAEEKWPGWPGHNVFRLIVPVLKVGSIIGRKGELIKKMCEETRARVRILEGPLSTPDRIVLITGKEEPAAPLSPAMDAVLRVCKRVNGPSSGEGDNTNAAAAGAAICSIKLLVASSQAINLIGKQGSIIRSIQESSGAAVRVLAEDQSPSYAASEERLVEIHGETLKVLSALEAVIGQLRKFLVDQSVIPIFEKITQERSADCKPDRVQPSMQQTVSASQARSISSEYSLSIKRDPLLFEREAHIEQQKVLQPGRSLYGQEHALGLRSTGLGHANVPIVTQVTQTMQVPLSYAGDIIGVNGTNIAYIRRVSGAVLTIQESRGYPDEIVVELKGSTSQVERAQQLIQEFVGNHKDPVVAPPSSYGKIDAGYSSYSQQLSETNYSSSYSPRLGGEGAYGSHGLGLGGYSGYRY